MTGEKRPGWLYHLRKSQQSLCGVLEPKMANIEVLGFPEIALLSYERGLWGPSTLHGQRRRSCWKKCPFPL